MKASGLFFLTGRPSIVNTRDAAGVTRKEWLFPLCERDGGKGVYPITGVWLGTEAAMFVRTHAARLKAGQALNLEFSRVRPNGAVLICRMTSAALAPDRWPVTACNPTHGPGHPEARPALPPTVEKASA